MAEYDTFEVREAAVVPQEDGTLLRFEPGEHTAKNKAEQEALELLTRLPDDPMPRAEGLPELTEDEQVLQPTVQKMARKLRRTKGGDE
jgi:hypothetical protein